MTRYHSAASRHTMARRRAEELHIFSSWGGLSHRNHYKRKPGDCGHARCGICHYDKYYQKCRTVEMVRADLDLREQLAEMN